MSCSPILKTLSEAVCTHSHSTPRGQGRFERKPPPKIHNLSASGDSTYSLLSPVFHRSFEIDTEDDKLDSQSFNADLENGRQSHADEISLENRNLTPWESWLLDKEKKARNELQRKFAEELKQEEERQKEQQRKEIKKTLAEENHKEWVRKKQDLERKVKEEKLEKELQEKASEEQKRIRAQEKNQAKYREWLQKKKEEEQERKKKEQEQEEKSKAEQLEKKEKAKKMFEEWLEQAKIKPRPTLHSYGYVNGKLTGYYDGSSYPAPGFLNPIPWKPIPMPPPPKETVKNPSAKKKKRAVSSQPYNSNVSSLYKPKDNLRVVGGTLRR